MVKKVVTKTVTETTKDDDKTTEKVTENDPKVSESKPNTADTYKKEKKKKKLSAWEREEMLIQNFVGLQHAMTNLSIKFGTLSDNLSELLRVFEGAARSFSKGDKADDSDMLKKIDSLLDQNKTIAKGLVLMEGKLRSRADEPGYHGYAAHGPEHHMQAIQTHHEPEHPAGMQPSIQQGAPSGMQTPGSPATNIMRPKPLPEL